MFETEAIRENYELGVLAGEARERQRIIKLLEQAESPSRFWGGIAWTIALIKGGDE